MLLGSGPAGLLAGPACTNPTVGPMSTGRRADMGAVEGVSPGLAGEEPS